MSSPSPKLEMLTIGESQFLVQTVAEVSGLWAKYITIHNNSILGLSLESSLQTAKKLATDSGVDLQVRFSFSDTNFIITKDTDINLELTKFFYTPSHAKLDALISRLYPSLVVHYIENPDLVETVVKMERAELGISKAELISEIGIENTRTFNEGLSARLWAIKTQAEEMVEKDPEQYQALKNMHLKQQGFVKSAGSAYEQSVASR